MTAAERLIYASVYGARFVNGWDPAKAARDASAAVDDFRNLAQTLHGTDIAHRTYLEFTSSEDV